MGREPQKHYGQEQCVVMVAVLGALDGVNKMSKPLGNYIGIAEPLRRSSARPCRCPTPPMWRYYELLCPPLQRAEIPLAGHAEGGRNPRDVKVMLAMGSSPASTASVRAEEALADFEARFQRNLRSPMTSLGQKNNGRRRPAAVPGARSRPGPRHLEAMRMVEQGRVRIDGERAEDRACCCVPADRGAAGGQAKFASGGAV